MNVPMKSHAEDIASFSRPYPFSIIIAALLAAIGAALMSSSSFAKTATTLYEKQCSGCHDQGSSRFQADTYRKPMDELRKAIKQGNEDQGMPAFANLAEADIAALAVLVREKAYANSHTASSSVELATQKNHTALGHSFKVEDIAQLDGTLWSLDFIKNHSNRAAQSLLVSSKEGVLYQLELPTSGKLADQAIKEVSGLPRVHVDNQGGLMEVAVLASEKPDSWVYLSYSEPLNKKDDKALTVVARGKIKKGKWRKHEVISRFDESFYTSAGYHYGSRIVFTDQHLYFSIGDRGKQDQAQDLSRPNGKIHRINFDGSIPKTNPFVTTKNALPSIYTYGNRNAQGLAVDSTGRVWEAEHGPRGGDEINLLLPSVNYGWPIITYGINYNGTPITERTHKEGMAQPKHFWVPSIAVSDITFYQGEQFYKWQNKLLVTSLKKEELRLLTIAGDSVVEDELIVEGLGRLRDVKVHADGSIWLALNRDGKGFITRISVDEAIKT